MQHAKTKQHKRALQGGMRAPEHRHFRDLVNMIQKNESLWYGHPFVGHRKKLRKIAFCLSAAAFEMDRDFLRRPGVLVSTFYQDARGKYLLCLARSAVWQGNDMRAQAYVAGLCKAGQSAEEIRQATLGVFSALCKPDAGLPAGGDLDEGLLRRYKKSLEVFGTDKASNEVRVGRMLVGKSMIAEHAYSQDLESSKMRLADPTHAAVRVLEQPWRSSEYLSEVFNRCVGGKASIVHKIQHSQDFQDEFNDRVQDIKTKVFDAKRIKNLQLIKPRFQASVQPTGRFVVFIRAMVATAIVITRKREGRDRKEANHFLSSLTTKDCVAIACMAEANYEILDFIRFLDNPSFDISMLPGEIDRMVLRLDILFLQNACLRSGFLQHLLDDLATPIVFRVAGRTHRIGGAELTQDLIDEVLAEIRCWLRVFMETLTAEFPTWELLSSFGMFALRSKVLPSDHDVHFERLALVYNLCAATLKIQVADVRPDAWMWKQRHPGTGDAECWRVAVGLRKHRRSNREALKHVILRLLAYRGCSTSGVEQTLSQLARQIKGARNNKHDNTAKAELKIKVDVCTLPEDDLDSLITLAQRTWIRNYGAPRLSGHNNRAPRSDHGTSRSTTFSEHAWLQRRRAGVDVSMASSIQRSRVETMQHVKDVVVDLSAKQELAISKQATKYNIKRALAYEDNMLCPEDVGSNEHEVRTHTGTMVAKRQTNDLQQTRKHQRLLECTGKVDRNLDGIHIHTKAGTSPPKR